MEALKDILSQASTTSYYKENNLQNIKSPEDLRRFRPLTTYNHYRSYVERVIDGESSVLQNADTDFFAATTGTTSGKSKLFPKNGMKLVWTFMKDVFVYTSKMMSFPGAMHIKPMFDLGFYSKIRWTAKGVKICSFSSRFTNFFGEMSAIPQSAKKIPDMFAAFYVQLIFGLKEREVGHLNFGFGSHGYTLLKMAADNWEDLVADIRYGRIREQTRSKLPIYILEDLESRLTPDHRRAAELNEIFSAGTNGFVPKVWPCLSYLVGIVTGPFHIYRKLLEDNFTGSVPIYTFIHGATEAMYGLNIWPNKLPEEFVIAPYSVFYEFIDIEDYDKESPRTYYPHQVEIGKRYEIIVTTCEGLYRYRSNDVIQITRFYNDLPVYVILQRADDNLSVYAEKTPVGELTTVVEECSRDWVETLVTNYTTTESIHLQDVIYVDSDVKMHYVLLLEVTGKHPSSAQLNKIDEKLRERVEAYNIYRENERIGPVAVLFTGGGAFSRLQDCILDINPDASAAQFKVPRLIRDKKKLCILLDNPDGSTED